MYKNCDEQVGSILKKVVIDKDPVYMTVLGKHITRLVDELSPFLKLFPSQPNKPDIDPLHPSRPLDEASFDQNKKTLNLIQLVSAQMTQQLKTQNMDIGSILKTILFMVESIRQHSDITETPIPTCPEAQKFLDMN